MIDEAQWRVLGEQAKEFSGIPDWARELCGKPLSEVEEHAEVKLENKAVDQSFIDFLQEQIELNARGEEWTALLKRRKEALELCVGKELSFLSVTGNGQVIWVRFDPEDNRVILVEAH